MTSRTAPKTLNQLLAAACARRSDQTALMHKSGGEWRKVTGAEWLDRARDGAMGLQAAGVRRGDRVALLSENRIEWFEIEAALQILGAVTVPIYPSLTSAQAAYIARDSGASALIASDAEQQEKFGAVLGDLPDARLLIALDAPVASFAARTWEAVKAAGREARKADGAAPERLAAAVRANDLATIIYTSGTTGNPKGVMLTQANLTKNALVGARSSTSLRPTSRCRCCPTATCSRGWSPTTCIHTWACRSRSPRAWTNSSRTSARSSRRSWPACRAFTKRCATGCSSRRPPGVR